MREIKLINVPTYVCDVTCSKCGRKKRFFIGARVRKGQYGDKNIKDARKSVPGGWNGWRMGKEGEELCVFCVTAPAWKVIEDTRRKVMRDAKKRGKK